MEWTCCECEHKFTEMTGDIDERMCFDCLDKEINLPPPCQDECFTKINNHMQCSALSPKKYHCSRLPNHTGKHVACGVEHAIVIWYDMQPIVDVLDSAIKRMKADNTIYLGKQGRGVV